MTGPVVQPVQKAPKPNPVTALTTGPVTALLSGLLPGQDAAQGLIDAILAIRRWTSVRHNWTRVLWFVGGSALMLLGGIMLLSPSVDTVAQAVTTVVPEAKAAKAVAAGV